MRNAKSKLRSVQSDAVAVQNVPSNNDVCSVREKRRMIPIVSAEQIQIDDKEWTQRFLPNRTGNAVLPNSLQTQNRDDPGADCRGIGSAVQQSNLLNMF